LHFQGKQKHHLSKRSGKSGSWLLQAPNFQAWEAGTQQLLHCPGIPGAGKTVLASTVVDHLPARSEDDVPVIWIYCNYEEKKSQTTDNLLGSLIAQFVQWRKMQVGRT